MAMLSDSIDVNAPVEAAFAAVSQLESMGKFSPENTGGKWLKGATGPALGAKFRGTNALGKDTWSTTATVVDFEPSSKFAFEVSVGPAKISKWEYLIEPTPTGSRITESWTDRRNALSKRFAKGVDRNSYTKISIRTTLESLKTHLEAN